jgi:hypothetical protein
MPRWSSSIVAVGLGLSLSLATSSASAQSRLSGQTWRQRERPDRGEWRRPPTRAALEMRFGPYSPEVDEEFGGKATPYADTFGAGSQFYFGLEADWQAIHIPYVGSLGPGFGWGYTSTSATAQVAECTPDAASGKTCDSGEETSLSIMPMHVSAVLRLDYLMHRTRFPLVPYGKIGLGLATWSVSIGSEDASYADPKEGTVDGSGTSYGLHLALGGMIALNGLDRRSSANLYESVGIQHLYFFGEWMKNNLDGLGSKPQMHVGTSTWVLGLAADM